MSGVSGQGGGHRTAGERRLRIAQALRERGSITVADVAREFRVSLMTARRDLAALTEDGRARRTRGGAVLPELTADERSFDSRFGRDEARKIRLGRAVAATLGPEETVFVDSSSTAYYVLREILDTRIALTVITNSVPAITAIIRTAGANVTLVGLGGSFHRLGSCFTGSETVRAIRGIYVDRLLLSVTGIEFTGYLTEADTAEAEIKREMIERARTVNLLAGGEKFDRRGLNVVAHLTQVDLAFLADPPPHGLEALHRSGVAVVAV